MLRSSFLFIRVTFNLDAVKAKIDEVIKNREGQ